MRPILMKGHERPLTFLKYNREGDLLFSCAKDHTPTVWYADDGERLGTYRGHNGAVWCCDVSRMNPFIFPKFTNYCLSQFSACSNWTLLLVIS
jgi:WD40 repeat protein